MAGEREIGGLNSDLLARAAARAARWPHLFAGIIESYQQVHGLSDEQVCAMLACDRDTLNHLRLCARPDPDPAAFAIDIERIAYRFGLDAGKLVAMVREVDALLVFERLAEAASPFDLSGTVEMLRAARDREDQEAGPEGTTSESAQGPSTAGTEAEAEGRDGGGDNGEGIEGGADREGV
jgi:hypothetical protein